MIRLRTKKDVLPSHVRGGAGSVAAATEKEWELRPGGMVVQKRTNEEQNHAPAPTIRVRVKYGSIYHEIRISSEATFGDLKNMLSGSTGLHHLDQKLLYKDKERDSKAFLDTAGVKDKSKLVLQEDPISREKRYFEMRKSSKMEKAAKSISEISLEVDSLAGQVSGLEYEISKGGKVYEKDVDNLTELLMNQLIKLDGVVVDGDVKLQWNMQVKRVQKYVETLDVLKLKIKNSTPTSNETQSLVQPQRYPNGNTSSPVQPSRHSASSGAAVVITTQWETFDSAPATMPGGTSTSCISHPAQPSFTWDLL